MFHFSKSNVRRACKQDRKSMSPYLIPNQFRISARYRTVCQQRNSIGEIAATYPSDDGNFS